MNILEQIHSPAELKYLSETQLEIVATQIRELIIKTVAQNGGHLAPCLGTVELTLALHKVFSCPRDKFVWDVGHLIKNSFKISEKRSAVGSPP